MRQHYLAYHVMRDILYINRNACHSVQWGHILLRECVFRVQPVVHNVHRPRHVKVVHLALSIISGHAFQLVQWVILGISQEALLVASVKSAPSVNFPQLKSVLVKLVLIGYVRLCQDQKYRLYFRILI